MCVCVRVSVRVSVRASGGMQRKVNKSKSSMREREHNIFGLMRRTVFFPGYGHLTLTDQSKTFHGNLPDAAQPDGPSLTE